MIIFLYTSILKFSVCLTLGKMDMVLNKSLSFFSTSCLHITSFLFSAQIYSSTNAFSVPVKHWVKHSDGRGTIACDMIVH